MENLKNTLLKKIESKTIEQKPRWYFIIYAVLGIILGIILFVITLFLIQFIILVIHEYTVAHTVGMIESSFGFIKKISFWVVIIIGIGSTFSFYKSLKNNTHLYQYRNLYTIIMVAAIIAGSVIGIQLFDRSMQFARIGEQPIPIIHQLDRAGRPPRPSGLLSGTVVTIRDTIITIRTHSQKIFYILVPPFEQIQNNFEIGDQITVFGIIHDDQVDAQRIVKQ